MRKTMTGFSAASAVAGRATMDAVADVARAADSVAGRRRRHTAVVLAAALAAVGAAWMGLASQLPTTEQLRVILTSSHILLEPAGDGTSLHPVCRCPVRLRADEISPHVAPALIATEDSRFYYHPGVDPLAIVRAVGIWLRTGELQGGSTLAMQLAKNAVLDPERTLTRKLREAVVALKLEWIFSKQEILELYLARADFGHRVFGLEQAARTFFRKSARDLNLYEAAVLVGMLKAPAALGPRRYPDRARARATTVLGRMLVQGDIDEKTMRQALRTGAKPSRLHPLAFDSRAFAGWIEAEIADTLPAGREAGSLKWIVTFDAWHQFRAEQAVRALTTAGEELNVGQAALVTMRADGAVRAMVGGRPDRAFGQNRALRLRQPGSVFKLFVYLAAVQNGWRLSSRVLDRPVTEGWPRNGDDTYRGWMALEDAFAESRNAASVWLLRRLGLERVIRLARELGVASPLRAEPSLALGTSEISLLEATAAYAVIANDGFRVRPHGVLGAIDRDGRVVHWRPAEPAWRIVDRGHVRLTTALLRRAVVSGTGRGAAFASASPVAGKTGTTQQHRDAWFVGFSGGMVTGIWAGNDDGEPMRRVSGGTLPAEAFRRFHANLRRDSS